MSEARESAKVWLPPRVAAAMLGINPATLCRWAKAGKVAAKLTPAGQRRYNLDDIRALLAVDITVNSDE
jgi:predicted site-specific integrase-resolvase